MIKRFRAFLQGVEFEMTKVSWPTMNELRGSTFFVDFGLSQIVEWVL